MLMTALRHMVVLSASPSLRMTQKRRVSSYPSLSKVASVYYLVLFQRRRIFKVYPFMTSLNLVAFGILKTSLLRNSGSNHVFLY